MFALHYSSNQLVHDGKIYVSHTVQKVADKFLALAKSTDDINVIDAITAAGYMGISLYTLALLANLALGY